MLEAHEIESHWVKIAQNQVMGRKIVKVRYLTVEECEDVLGWYERALAIQLDDGNILFPSRDDEGNGAGAVEYCSAELEKVELFPVIPFSSNGILFANSARNKIMGRTVTEVGYLSAEEMDRRGWYSRPIYLVLDGGARLVFMADDEGNNGGAVFTNDERHHVFPVLPK